MEALANLAFDFYIYLIVYALFGMVLLVFVNFFVLVPFLDLCQYLFVALFWLCVALARCADFLRRVRAAWQRLAQARRQVRDR